MNTDDMLTRSWIIRGGRVDERLALEDLQRSASLVYDDYRQQLLDNPDVIELPRAQLADGHVRVAEADGRLLGFAVVLPRDGWFELDGLFVTPDQWRRGIGRALIDDACQRLAADGGGRLQTVANPRAEGFYEKLGFRPVGMADTLFGPARRMMLEIQAISPSRGQS